MSKLKDEGAVYTPSSNVPYTNIFRSLCNDPDYPCRDCVKCKNPLSCVRIESCAEYRTWFSNIWERIRKALKIETTEKTETTAETSYTVP